MSDQDLLVLLDATQNEIAKYKALINNFENKLNTVNESVRLKHQSSINRMKYIVQQMEHKTDDRKFEEMLKECE